MENVSDRINSSLDPAPLGNVSSAFPALESCGGHNAATAEGGGAKGKPGASPDGLGTQVDGKGRPEGVVRAKAPL